MECATAYTKINDTRYDCPNGHSFWNNPKACVAVVITQDDKILVSKRGVEPRKGTYDLPGGFVDYYETIEQCAIREIKEETGLVLHDMVMLTSFTDEYLKNVPTCDIVVLATSWDGEPNPADDSAALEWQPLEFLDGPLFSAPYPGLSEIIRTTIN